MTRKMVVFDFDGTLVESHGAYTNALQEFSESRGLPWDGKKMAAGYTNPAKYDLGWGIPLEQQTQTLKELNEFYFSEVKNNLRFMPTVFPGTQEALEELSKDYDLSIVTAQARESLLIILNYFDLKKYFPMFRSLCCARDRGYPIKPAPDALQCLLRDTAHDVEDIVVVGDTIADIGMANAAGAKSIAALWGLHDRERMLAEGPTVVCESISELPQAVNVMFNQ